MYYHLVTALTHSVSVSVWSKSPEIQHMHTTARLPLPLKTSWSAEKLVACGRLYMDRLLQHVLPKDQFSSPQRFYRMLYEQRYKAIVENVPEWRQLLRRDAQGGYCSGDVSVDVARECKQWIDADAEQGEASLFLAQHIQEFMKSPDHDRRSVWLANFVEQLALTVTNDPAKVPRFILDLFRC